MSESLISKCTRFARELAVPAALASRPQVNRRAAAAALALYGVLAAVLLPFYRLSIDPDGTAYISAARKIVAGEFSSAVTGHWSPLLPWLLAPWFRSGFPEVLAIKTTLLLAGVTVLLGFHRLSYRFVIAEPVRTAALFAFVPMVLYYALLYCTPDLIMLSLMLWYLCVLLDPEYAGRAGAGFGCGVLAGVGYLAKAYALPFFCLHFSAVHLFYGLRAECSAARKRVAAQFVLGMLSFALLSAPWIATLSLKYRTFTISSGAGYNWSFNTPSAKDTPSMDLGLNPPRSARDISAWDDLPEKTGIKWSPFDSLGSFGHWVFVMGKNAAKVVVVLEAASVFSLPVVLAGLLVMLLHIRRWRTMPHWSLPLFTLLVFAAGYLPLWIVDRYVWLTIVLVLLLGAQGVSLILPLCGSRAVRVVLTWALALSFVGFPIYRLSNGFNAWQDLQRQSEAIRRDYAVAGHIASNGRFRDSLFLCYFLGAQYYGHTRGLAEQEMERKLAELGVDYYLVWTGTDRKAPVPTPRFLERYREIAPSDFPELRIYSLRERKESPDR
ncbi:MAG: hypothetical protein HY343_00995 [Lentisphaerae bacterium]|nr:hypothetical protein [Lentisphaerota bacterium]